MFRGTSSEWFYLLRDWPKEEPVNSYREIAKEVGVSLGQLSKVNLKLYRNQIVLIGGWVPYFLANCWRQERKKQIGFQLTPTLNDLAETRRKN